MSSKHGMRQNVSPQMTLTADELTFHKICVTYLFNIIRCTNFMENQLISC